MRPKELCFLVAFHTTTAGCGLAWRMPIGEKEKMKSLLTKCDLKYENIYELMI